MPQLIPLLIILPLIVFWIVMFRHMSRNAYLPSWAKDQWMLAFLLLNVFGAGLYYLYEYRDRR